MGFRMCRGATRLATWLAVAFAAAACGGDDDDGGGNGFVPPSDTKCAARTGAYTVSFVQKNGDCGDLDPQIVIADGAPDPGCTGTTSPADACVETEDVTCPGAQGTSTRIVGQLRWDQAGSMATGTWQVTIADASGLVLCQSTYDVTASR